MGFFKLLWSPIVELVSRRGKLSTESAATSAKIGATKYDQKPEGRPVAVRVCSLDGALLLEVELDTNALVFEVNVRLPPPHNPASGWSLLHGDARPSAERPLRELCKADPAWGGGSAPLSLELTAVQSDNMLVVSGAGTPEVHGRYRPSGEKHGAQVYQKVAKDGTLEEVFVRATAGGEFFTFSTLGTDDDAMTADVCLERVSSA